MDAATPEHDTTTTASERDAHDGGTIDNDMIDVYPSPEMHLTSYQGKVLYRAHAKSMAQLFEFAIEDKVDLSFVNACGLDLSDVDFRNAKCFGGDFRGTKLRNCKVNFNTNFQMIITNDETDFTGTDISVCKS